MKDSTLEVDDVLFEKGFRFENILEKVYILDLVKISLYTAKAVTHIACKPAI